MLKFRAVPVEQAIRAVRAWAELEWPVTREQALAEVARLGWVTSPDDSRVFTTDFGLDAEDGALTAPNGAVALVGFRLSARVPRVAGEQFNDAARAAFNSYLAALAALYGKPTLSSHRQVLAADWVLPNGAGLMLATTSRLVKVEIESPALKRLEGFGER